MDEACLQNFLALYYMTALNTANIPPNNSAL